ncbi:MAG: uroporphyrinogen decarboxylase [Treponema sp.]|nr:uroporphyrinogen decarboxylase [Treponema sp.]
MNPRELVLESLAKREPEVIPWQLDLTDEVHDRLAGYFKDADFEDKLGNALAQERNEIITPLGGPLVRDMYDIVWRREYKGDFGVVEDYLLKEPDFGGYRFPVPDQASIRAKCGRLAARRDKQFTMYIIGFSLFERAWALRSMPELLMDFILNPDFVDELLKRITDYNLAVMDIVAEYPIDCIFFGDDWGQQSGLIMGPEHWRRFIKPHIQRMYSHAASKGMLVAQHSCGDVHELFDDLVEAGLAIYNTFQPEVYDVESMKRRYGPAVTFYGGISTQRLLPFATPDEVKREMRRLMGIIGRGGGYIVAPTHSIPDDVSTENILAFLDVVRNQKP